jgi:hypothetical protein
MVKCVDHLEFVGETCPDCNLEVDDYGNTEAQFDNCCFPDCGCDGARLCMAPSGGSDRACRQNVEGMWSGKTTEQRKAAMSLVGDIGKEKQGPKA